MFKTNAANRLRVTAGPQILRLKIRRLPLQPHLKTHYGALLREFPELLNGESIPVYKSGMPGRERYTVTNDQGTDTPWNYDTGTAFTFSEDEVNSTFQLGG